MVKISLYFFEENVLVAKFDTSWLEASEVIANNINNYQFEFGIESESHDKELFLNIKKQVLAFKDCEDPDIVCDVLILILESLDLCTFDKKMHIGTNSLLRGRLLDKNFSIEISEEEV